MKRDAASIWLEFYLKQAAIAHAGKLFVDCLAEYHGSSDFLACCFGFVSTFSGLPELPDLHRFNFGPALREQFWQFEEGALVAALLGSVSLEILPVSILRPVSFHSQALEDC